MKELAAGDSKHTEDEPTGDPALKRSQDEDEEEKKKRKRINSCEGHDECQKGNGSTIPPSIHLPEGASCTSNSTPPSYSAASFMLRSTNGKRVFNNPKKVSEALLSSSFSKYILEGETRNLGNGTALIIAVHEHNVTKVPELSLPSFKLGEWEVTCRRAEKEGVSFQYGKVGPLDEESSLEEIKAALRTFDGGECTEVTWIHPRQLSRFTAGKWLRLKVRGTIPTRVGIFGLVYRPRPFILPMLRCQWCLKVGHSSTTCRSSVRCVRCSGPHSSSGEGYTCSRPFHCFQCGGPHGPRSPKCPFNLKARQFHATMMGEGKTLPEINTQLRQLQLTNPRPTHQTRPRTTSPATRTPSRPVQDGISFADITCNRYEALQAQEGEAREDPEDDIISAPLESTLTYRRYRKPTRPRRNPPSTPTRHLTSPSQRHRSELEYFSTEAEVHHPPASQRRQDDTTTHPTSSQHLSPPRYTRRLPRTQEFHQRHRHRPSDSGQGTLSKLFNIVMKAFQLHQQGSNPLEIVSTLWPDICDALSPFFQ